MTDAPSLTVVPSMADYRQNFLKPLLSGAVASLVAFVIIGAISGRWWLIPTIVVLVAATAAVTWAYLRNSRVTIADGRLGYRNLFGATRSWPLSEATTAVFTENLLPSAASVTAQPTAAGRNLFVFADDGRLLFRVTSGAWSHDSLEAVAHALPKAQIDDITRNISMAELERLHPHSISWAARHPFVLAFSVAGGIVLIAVLAVVIAVSVS